MSARRSFYRIVTISVVVLLLGAGSERAGAQVTAGPPGFGEVPYLTVGYAADAPSQLLGFGVTILPVALDGWGVYGDVKWSLDSPADRSSFDPSLSSQEAQGSLGDDLQRVESEWTTLNLAVARAMTPDLALYLGAGYAWETVYHEYLDETRERGTLGFYWVEDQVASGNRVNVLGGMLLRFGRHLVFQVGGEASPGGFTVGAGLALPDLW